MTIFRIIDTETCGFEGGIVEIASVDVIDGGLPVNPMSDYVKPDRPIGFGAMAIHHITEDMVADKPSVGVVVGRYQTVQLFVAHNAQFDRGVLPDMGGQWLCTWKLAARMWPDLESHANQYLRYALGLNPRVPEHLHAHRALYDCYVTAALFSRIYTESGWSVEEMLEISNQPILLRTMRKGKYAGKTYEEIARIDSGYLSWILTTDMDDNIKHTARHWLKG
ncbi:TPA: exodeoxyribonuclease X [Enterobacter ludwigii]|nr:exodeoxyribonuclease X [Enterobacter ludwigii]HDR2597923.1 exodeoxyribonuclease X [Enterobacter ludwigii]